MQDPIYLEILNEEDEIVERVTVLGEQSWYALERLVEGFGYKVQETSD